MDLELQNQNQNDHITNKNTFEYDIDEHGAKTPPPPPPPQTQAPQMSKTLKITLIIISIILMAIGNTGGPLLLRYYFSIDGTRLWLSSSLQTFGFPLILIPLLFSYLHRRKNNNNKLFYITPNIFISCAFVGLLIGLDDFLYTYGLSFLPVSTSSLLLSTQLAFTALFAFLLVKQKFTAYSLNSVALLSVGAVILGLHASSDRPANVSRREYYMGFVLTLGAAVLYGLVLPLIELMYAKAEQAITYTLVMEMQLVMGFFATALCVVGMMVNKDFQVIPRESRHTELSEAGYYNLIVWSAIAWQGFFLGAVGVIFCVNTLLAGILIAVFIPVTELLAVIFLHENFSSEKAVALALALWGLASYSYGEYRLQRKKKKELNST